MDPTTDPRVLDFQKEEPDETAEDTLIRLLPSIEHYRALESKISRKIAELRELVENKPMINTEEIRRDIRYQLGGIKYLNWVLDQPTKPD